MFGESIDAELLRHVMSIKDDISGIKIQIHNFEVNHETFKEALIEIEKKVDEIEIGLKINALGVAEIERREVLYRRLKRFVVDNVLSPFFSALQKGWFYLIITTLTILLTWLLILIGFDVENLHLREILR